MQSFSTDFNCKWSQCKLYGTYKIEKMLYLFDVFSISLSWLSDFHWYVEVLALFLALHLYLKDGCNWILWISFGLRASQAWQNQIWSIITKTISAIVIFKRYFSEFSIILVFYISLRICFTILIWNLVHIRHVRLRLDCYKGRLLLCLLFVFRCFFL